MQIFSTNLKKIFRSASHYAHNLPPLPPSSQSLSHWHRSAPMPEEMGTRKSLICILKKIPLFGASNYLVSLCDLGDRKMDASGAHACHAHSGYFGGGCIWYWGKGEQNLRTCEFSV